MHPVGKLRLRQSRRSVRSLRLELPRQLISQLSTSHYLVTREQFRALNPVYQENYYVPIDETSFKIVSAYRRDNTSADVGEGPAKQLHRRRPKLRGPRRSEELGLERPGLQRQLPQLGVPGRRVVVRPPEGQRELHRRDYSRGNLCRRCRKIRLPDRQQSRR